jgi:hypothetical protein
VTAGEYFQQVLFLKKLQAEMTRLLAVSNLQLAVDTDSNDSSGVTMTVTGQVFALPDADTGTTTGSATATATPSSSATQAPATTAGGSNS